VPGRPGPLPTPEPKGISEMISADMVTMNNGKQFLCLADRYSVFVAMYGVKSGGTSKEIINHIMTFYA
jgi:hypothetical protein